jgi:hypothetical protein
MLKQWGIERYKDFLISSSPYQPLRRALTGIRRELSFGPGRFSSIVVVKRIQGPIFNKEAAEQHGLQLCKDRVDARRR